MFYIFKKNNNLAYCRNIHFPTSKIGKYYFLLMKLINKYVNIKFVKSLLLNILKYCYEKIFSTYWFILPLEYYTEFEKINFEGFLINIPKNYIKYLEYCYGDSWMKPQKNWSLLNDSGFVEINRLNKHRYQ